MCLNISFFKNIYISGALLGATATVDNDDVQSCQGVKGEDDVIVRLNISCCQCAVDNCIKYEINIFQ